MLEWLKKIFTAQVASVVIAALTLMATLGWAFFADPIIRLFGGYTVEQYEQALSDRDAQYQQMLSDRDATIDTLLNETYPGVYQFTYFHGTDLAECKSQAKAVAGEYSSDITDWLRDYRDRDGVSILYDYAGTGRIIDIRIGCFAKYFSRSENDGVIQRIITLSGPVATNELLNIQEDINTHYWKKFRTNERSFSWQNAIRRHGYWAEDGTPFFLVPSQIENIEVVIGDRPPPGAVEANPTE